jgi:hypothetical protein
MRRAAGRGAWPLGRRGLLVGLEVDVDFAVVLKTRVTLGMSFFPSWTSGLTLSSFCRSLALAAS